MKSPFFSRNLGLSVGMGLCLGLGLLSLSTYSSSQASSKHEPTSEGPQPEHSQESLTPDGSQPIDSFITYDAPPRPINPVPLKEDGPTLPIAPSPIALSPIEGPAKGHSAIASTPSTSTPSESIIAPNPSHSTKQISPASPISSSVPSMIDASTSTNAAIEQTLAQTIPGIASCPFAEPTESNTSSARNEHRYTYHAVDLNGDRQDEVLVQVLGPITCGTGGCTTLVLQASSDTNPTANPLANHAAYDVVTQMSVVNFPVIVSDRTSSGWNDLLVMVSGGGAQPGYRQLKFDGQSYPTNPSVETIIAASGDTPSGKVLTVSDEVGAIAPILTAPDCES